MKSRNAPQDGAGDGHIAQLAGAFKPKVEALMPPILTEENTPAEYAFSVINEQSVAL